MKRLISQYAPNYLVPDFNLLSQQKRKVYQLLGHIICDNKSERILLFEFGNKSKYRRLDFSIENKTNITGINHSVNFSQSE